MRDWPFLNANTHSPASSARSTKRRVRGCEGGCFCQWELKAPTDRSRSHCVDEQVAKLGPVSRAAGMDCECPLYRRSRNGLQISVLLQNKHFPALSVRGTLSGG